MARPFVADITARFDPFFIVAHERHRESASGHLVVDAHRLRVENFDRVRLAACVEDEDFQMFVVGDFDRSDDEDVLGRE